MLHPTQHQTITAQLVTSTLGICLALMLSTGFVMANEFIVQPASVALAAKQPTATVQLTNSASEAKIVRIQVMSYTKENGHERLSPSNRLIVHPDQVKLQAGASQSIRVGLRLSGPLWDEEHYRLLLTEIPQPPNMGAVDTKPRNPFSLRLAVLPVSVFPPGQSLSGR